MERNMQSRKQNDYPELQIGYPERNDVRNPNSEMERIHVDFDSFELKRTTADGMIRENRDQESLRDK